MTWADTNYAHKKKITIANGKVPGDLNDFPVLINITDSDLTGCLANGYDIKFYDSLEGTQLKHERQEWDNSTGKLITWVKIPSLSSSVDTIFYIYYEYPSEGSDQADPTNVWDSDFMGVWHMIDATTSTIGDSTSNVNTGNKLGANEPVESSSGKIGNCQDFDGTDDYITVTDDGDLSSDSVTVECWAKSDDDGDNYRHLIWKPYGADYGGDYNLRIISVGTNVMESSAKNDTTAATNTLSEAVTTNWQYWVVKHDSAGDTLYLWLDMTTSDFATLEGALRQTGDPFTIGTRNRMAGGLWGFFDGLLDEIRVSQIARSDNWLTTTFNTTGDPANFMGFGGEEKQAIVVKRGRVIYGLKVPRIVRPGRVGA